MIESAWGKTGALPRLIRPNILWSGGCVDSTYANAQAHGHFSMYVVRGSEKSIIIDSGHPMHWGEIERDIEMFLEGRPLDYVFPTHSEFPHAGLLPQWLAKYPDLKVVGNVQDFALYYPEAIDRFWSFAPGDSLDLGDRKLVFVPAIWRDLPDTLWAFDTLDRVLFVADGFAYLHPHAPGQCDFFMSENPAPDIGMIQYFNERALQWTRYTDARVTFDDMDKLLSELKPALIAGAHGNLVDNLDEFMPLFKRGMIMGTSSVEPASPA